MEGFASMVFVTPAAGILIVPVVVTGPPVRPAPVLTLVTVPPEAVLVSVTVPPSATVPPPDNPDPAFTVMEGFASMVLVTPAAGILIVPVAVIGPPVRPAPVLTLVTVPPPPLPPPGNVWPGAKVINPLLAIESPVSVGEFPPDPNSRFKEPEGVDESFPAGSAIHRKSCAMADDFELLNEDACKSRAFELKPALVVAVPVLGNNVPAADTVPLKVPVDAASPLAKAAVVPVRAPLTTPPESCR
jgi:hypothetical protein